MKPYGLCGFFFFVETGRREDGETIIEYPSEQSERLPGRAQRVASRIND